MTPISHLFDNISPQLILPLVAIFFLIAIGLLLMYIFMLSTLQKTLENISPENRKMQPGQVWLLLIPYFSLGWIFVVVMRMSDSVGLEMRKRNIESFQEKPGFALGMVWGATGVLAFLLAFLSVWPLYAICLLAQVTCWIIFWMRYRSIKMQLENSPINFQHNLNYLNVGSNYQNQYYTNYYQQPNVPPPPVRPTQANEAYWKNMMEQQNPDRWAPKPPTDNNEHVS